MIKFKLKWGARISLDVPDRDTSAAYSIEAPKELEALIRLDLGLCSGANGHAITDACSGLALNAALSTAKMQSWQPELIEGEEILGKAGPQLPTGAID